MNKKMREMKIKATRLKAERLKHGYTLRQVADAIGVGPTAINAYEMLQRTPSLAVYRRLLAFYEVDPAVDLFEVIEVEGNFIYCTKSL